MLEKSEVRRRKSEDYPHGLLALNYLRQSFAVFPELHQLILKSRKSEDYFQKAGIKLLAEIIIGLRSSVFRLNGVQAGLYNWHLLHHDIFLLSLFENHFHLHPVCA